MFYSTEALERMAGYLHTGDPTPETADDFRNGDWDRYEEKDMTIASAALAIATDARIREALDWDRLVSETCMTKEELIADVARAAWVEYWDGMVQTGWFEETFEEESEPTTEQPSYTGEVTYITVCCPEGAKVAKFVNDGITLNTYFAGWDFTKTSRGMATWTGPDGYGALVMSLDEAEQLADELQSREPTTEPSDPVRDSLQAALDVAWADVAWADDDRAWEEFKSAACSDPSDYERKRFYLEGFVFAIEAAGYRVDDQRRVVKKEV